MSEPTDEIENGDIDRILSITVRSEADREEEILWSAKPEAGSMAMSLLICPLLWLGGLFLFAMGMLKSSPDYNNNLLYMMILILVLAAVGGMVEIIAIPQQARKAIYVVTNLRTFIIKLKGKFGFQGMTNYSVVRREKVREEKSTLRFFYLFTVPIHVIFLFLVFDLLLGIIRNFDPFTVAGFALLSLGWIIQWYQDMRFPIPRFRECPRAFYFINEWLATVESVEHGSIDRAVLHRGRAGVGDIFLISRGRGCLRLKAVPEAEKVYGMLNAKLANRKSSD